MGTVTPVRLISVSRIRGVTPDLPAGWVEVEYWYLDGSEDWVSERYVGEVAREDGTRIWLRAMGFDGRPSPIPFTKSRHLDIRGPGRG